MKFHDAGLRFVGVEHEEALLRRRWLTGPMGASDNGRRQTGNEFSGAESSASTGLRAQLAA